MEWSQGFHIIVSSIAAFPIALTLLVTIIGVSSRERVRRKRRYKGRKGRRI